MLNLEDERWLDLHVDPRPLLVQLQETPEDPVLWNTLIEILYAGEEVSEASYAAVPVMIGLGLETMPWQMLVLVASIEMARTKAKSPVVPIWVMEAYEQSLSTLAEECMARLPDTEGEEAARGMLCIISMWKGFRVFGRVVLDYSEEELAEILPG